MNNAGEKADTFDSRVSFLSSTAFFPLSASLDMSVLE
jgi:hypothetical protein